MKKMLRVVALLSCVALVLAGGKDPLDDRIVGGQPAANGQFPYQISMRLRNNGQHHCGGTIISPRIIVTAAHCVYQHYVTDFIVVVGTNYLSSGGQVYTLANAVYHQSYSPENMSNDIALLKTTADIQYSAVVQPLPLDTSAVPAGAPMVLSGWGLTSWPGNQPPNALQMANLINLDINTCAQILQPSQIFTTQICTFTRPGQGACAGDSGGPLVYAGRLAGVVSWGRPCAIGYPDVFTRVSSYADWISQTSASM